MTIEQWSSAGATVFSGGTLLLAWVKNRHGVRQDDLHNCLEEKAALKRENQDLRDQNLDLLRKLVKG